MVPIARVEQPLDFAKGTDEAVVVTDLRDHAPLARERGKILGVLEAQRQRLLAEDVQVPLERGTDHSRVRSRGRRDQHRIEVEIAEIDS